ncbi:MAG TPA: hypothetical protein VLV83_19225 [Acidobacteriota bacterium]|nr:hypothetical protein [Acidobacteriota bacterium]
MNDSANIGQPLERLQKTALAVGAVAAVLSLLAALTDFEAFSKSYLMAFVFWLGLPLSCLAFLMLHNLVGGRWSFFIRRQLEAGSRTLPAFVIFFIPVGLAVSATHIYEWAHYVVGGGDAILDHKSGYLNQTFFYLRTAGSFIIWIGLAVLLNKWSAQQDRKGADGSLVARMNFVSGPGIVIYFLTVTLLAVDLLMSLDPHWFSTIYALIYIIGQALLTLSFLVLITRRLAECEPLRAVASPQRFHELGNFMLAFVMLWAYLSVSQLLIIWSANLPEVNPWYVTRFQDPWATMGFIILIFHFAVPFLLLLWRSTKRRPNLLRNVALGLIFMRLVELFWVIKPSMDPSAEASFAPLSLATDLVTWAALGGLWIYLFLAQLKKRSLLPVNDPRLPHEFVQKLSAKRAEA